MSLDLINDSTITLVNPDPPATLEFSHSSVINAVIFLRGRPIYKILTSNPATGSTKITDLATGQLIVTIRRRSLQPDTIKFALRYDGKALLLKEWLQESKAEDGRQMWTVRTPVGCFVWRTDITLRLVLTPESDPNRSVAWVNLPEQDGAIFTLTLAPGTESFRDEIVAAFCVLEQRLRVKEKVLYQSVGKAVFIPM